MQYNVTTQLGDAQKVDGFLLDGLGAINLSPGREALMVSVGAGADPASLMNAPALSAPIQSAPPMQSAPPIIGTGVTEAEDLELVAYVVEVNPGLNPSGGELIRLENPGPATGTATGQFAGNAGTYDIDIGFFDEGDGVSTWTLLINGQSIGTFFGSAGNGAGIPRTQTFTVQLEDGDTIAVQGERDQGELARLDFVDIQPVVPGSADIEVGITEFEDLALIGFTVEDRAGVSGRENVFTLTQGSASGTFNGPDGAYELDIDYIIENDGEPDWRILVNGVEQATFTGPLADNATALAEFILPSVNLETGDTITVEGVRDGNALARLDALKLTPLDPGINTAPLAANDIGQMLDTESRTFDVLANDSDANADPLTVTALIDSETSTPVNPGDTIDVFNRTFEGATILVGQATLNSDFSITLNPTDGFEGEFFLEYEVSDGTNTDVGELAVDVFNGTIIPPIEPSFDVSGSGARSVSLEIAANAISQRDITINWADGTPNASGTLTADNAGSFNHTFDTGGVFDVIIDADSSVADQQTTVRVFVAASGTGNGDGEALQGDNGVNALLGDGGNDILKGGAGDDFIRGETGLDFIEGGEGADTLVGGGGRDVFNYGATSEGGDTIVDFVPGIDQIRVDAAGFGGDLFIGKRVELVISTGAATLNEDGAFLYNPNAGTLFYDVSGAGFSQPVLIATLEGAPSITAGDILVSADLTLQGTRTAPAPDRAEPASAPALAIDGDEGTRPQPDDTSGTDSAVIDQAPSDVTQPNSQIQRVALKTDQAADPLDMSRVAENTDNGLDAFDFRDLPFHTAEPVLDLTALAEAPPAKASEMVQQDLWPFFGPDDWLMVPDDEYLP